MTPEQRRTTLHAMVRYGNSFVSRLAEVWHVEEWRADAGNAQRLAGAFPELLVRYGPGSEPYAGAARIEAL